MLGKYASTLGLGYGSESAGTGPDRIASQAMVQVHYIVCVRSTLIVAQAFIEASARNPYQ